MLIVPLFLMHYSLPVYTFFSFHSFSPFLVAQTFPDASFSFVPLNSPFFWPKYYLCAVRDLNIVRHFSCSSAFFVFISKKSSLFLICFCLLLRLCLQDSTSTLRTFAYLSFILISHFTASRLTLGVLCCIDTSHLPLSPLQASFKFFRLPLLCVFFALFFAVTDCISLSPSCS